MSSLQTEDTQATGQSLSDRITQRGSVVPFRHENSITFYAHILPVDAAAASIEAGSLFTFLGTAQ